MEFSDVQTVFHTMKHPSARLPSQADIIMFLKKGGWVEHAFSTIDFNPNIKFEVDVSLCRCATKTAGDWRCWPALCKQLMDSGKARRFFTRSMSIERTTGHYTVVKQEEFMTRYFPTCEVSDGL